MIQVIGHMLSGKQSAVDKKRGIRRDKASLVRLEIRAASLTLQPLSNPVDVG
jgi:hypothetical protein